MVQNIIIFVSYLICITILNITTFLIIFFKCIFAYFIDQYCFHISCLCNCLQEIVSVEFLCRAVICFQLCFSLKSGFLLYLAYFYQKSSIDICFLYVFSVVLSCLFAFAFILHLCIYLVVDYE